MGTVLYPFPERQGYLCTKSIDLGTQPFLEYVIVKKMSLAIIPETEFELTRICNFVLWTCVSPINPIHFCGELCCTGVLAATGNIGKEKLESLRCCRGNSVLSVITGPDAVRNGFPLLHAQGSCVRVII